MRKIPRLNFLGKRGPLQKDSGEDSGFHPNAGGNSLSADITSPAVNTSFSSVFLHHEDSHQSSMTTPLGHISEHDLSLQTSTTGTGRVGKRLRASLDKLNNTSALSHQGRHVSATPSSPAGRAMSDSGSSDEEADVQERLLSTGYAESTIGAKIDMVWSMYEKQIRLYKKYKARSDNAQEKMNHLTRILLRLASGDKDHDSVNPIKCADDNTKGRISLQAAPVDQNGAKYAAAVSPPPPPPLAMAENTSTQGSPQRLAISKSIRRTPYSYSINDESIRSPLSDPENKSYQTEFRSVNKPNSVTNHTGSECPAVLSDETPVRAFQFSTQAMKSFKLKPRAATVCTFDGLSGQTAVAYGFDGALQFWDPGTRMKLLSIEKEELGMDLVDHVSQLTPSLVVALAGGSTTKGQYENRGSIALLSKKRHAKQDILSFGPPAHCTDSPHTGDISVVEGMPDCRGINNSTALMLSGGESDRSVYMWKVGLSDRGAVAGVQHAQKMNTHHTTRISALCYVPLREYTISGADGIGRINVNDTETGQLVVDNDHNECGGGIGSISVCPADGNLAMVCCTAKGKQIQIFDLRQSLSTIKPALFLGKGEGFRNSRYIRPAWHPDGRLVFCPLNEDKAKASDNGTVFIWDTRYVNCREEEPQTYSPHSGSIWSVCFAQSFQKERSNKPTLVSVSSDRKIAFTDFSI